MSSRAVKKQSSYHPFDSCPGPVRKFSVQVALVNLGLPRDLVYAKHHRNKKERSLFGNRGNLWIVADAVCALRKRTLKRNHPDNGGKHGIMIRLNADWPLIKKWFERRGITI